MTATLDATEAPDSCLVRISGIGHDIPWTEGGGITEIQSYPWLVVNAIYDRLTTMTLFRGWTIRRINRALPIESGIHIPFLGIYQRDETLGPDGDYNLGDIRFTNTVNIGFQIVIKNNDPVACLQMLDRCSTYLINQILRDNTLTNLYQAAAMPDGGPALQGFPRGRIVERWGTVGQRNETPVGERLVELSFVFKTGFYPTEFPDLERIALQTGWPVGGDADDVAGVHQVSIVYDFARDTGASVPYPLPPDAESPLPFPPMSD
jgi:hypothetical protein